mmetsp:Transcript_7079/g.15617  ORF Transcript_7079/g.15617 Transcript_7079/m.15617 type:complete len:338 (+) Transcript_7079:3606-4619(+)
MVRCEHDTFIVVARNNFRLGPAPLSLFCFCLGGGRSAHETPIGQLSEVVAVAFGVGSHAQISEIALCIFVKIRAHRNPNMLLAPARNILHDESGQRASLSHTGSVPQKKSRSYRGRLSLHSSAESSCTSRFLDIALGISAIRVRARRHCGQLAIFRNGVLLLGVRPRQIHHVPLTSVHHRFQLQIRQFPLVHDARRHGQVVRNVRGGHRRQGGVLHHGIGMVPSVLELGGFVRGVGNVVLDLVPVVSFLVGGFGGFGGGFGIGRDGWRGGGSRGHGCGRHGCGHGCGHGAWTDGCIIGVIIICCGGSCGHCGGHCGGGAWSMTLKHGGPKYCLVGIR